MTDACLVSIAEHGLVPSVQAARMTLSAAPESLQGAVAAGLLGCGSVILGATEYAGAMLRDGLASGADPVAIVREHREARRALPGFGHPLHRDGDPRTVRLLGAQRRARRLRRARRAAARDRGRGAGGLRPRAAAQRLGRDRRADARPRPARLHAQGDPAARAHRRACSATCARSTSARSASSSRASPRPGSSTTDDAARPRVEARDPAEQRARDEEALRGQLASLRERSPLLPRQARRRRAVGLDDLPGLPFTTKDEIRESLAAAPPLGRHLAAPPEDVRRVYSTSGTTGDPSYIAVTDADLAGWAEIGARSYAACGIAPGQRAVLDLQLRPVRGRRGARRLDRASARP